MADGECIKKDVMLAVLRFSLGDDAVICVGEKVTITVDGSPSVYELSEEVPRRMAIKFGHKYNIRFDLFWHPERMQKGNDHKH